MSAKRAVGFLVLCWTFLLIVHPGFCGVGKALEEAMKSRESCSVEEVTRQYLKAADEAGSKEQRSNILGLLADYLMEKKEWDKAIGIGERILAEGVPVDKAGAYYAMAKAYMALGSSDEARETCTKLQAECPGNTWVEFSRTMKELSPGSVHAKLAEYLAEAPSGIQREAVMSTTVPTVREESGRSAPVVAAFPALQPVESKDASTAKNPVTVGVRGWNSSLAGNIDAKGMSLNLDSGSDIGAQSKMVLSGRWDLSSKDQFRLDYSHFDHHGRLNRGVTFDNLAYNTGASLEVRSSIFDVGGARLLDNSTHGAWRFLYGLKFSRMFMRVAQQMAAGTRAGELTSNYSVPYFGIEGEAKLSDNVTLDGSAKLFSLHQSGAAARLTDIDLAFRFGRDYDREPSETEWYGTLGYRFFLLHGEADNDSAEIRYGGLTFGIESRF